jgi:hypothetical protein
VGCPTEKTFLIVSTSWHGIATTAAETAAGLRRVVPYGLELIVLGVLKQSRPA